ncbi:MAG: hypothetical protein L7U52_02520 [Alphaproteobacteria bacterium]|nr:hypothetical protein [Alphaproteobacteria bacterium]
MDVFKVTRVFVFLAAFATLFSISAAGFASDFTIASASINEGKIKKAHACKGKGGDEITPSITVKGIPKDTAYLALIVEDSRRGLINWNVFNIIFKGSEYNLEAGKGTNGVIGKSSGKTGYFGICSTNNPTQFTAFALKQRISASSFGFSGKAFTAKDFEKKFKKSIIGKTSIKAKLEK